MKRRRTFSQSASRIRDTKLDSLRDAIDAWKYMKPSDTKTKTLRELRKLLREAEAAPVMAFNGKGKDLNTATKIRERFMDKEHSSVRRMGWEWPKRMNHVGSCEAIMYTSDKWQKDGKKIDYKHVAEGAQKLYLRSDLDDFGGKSKTLPGLPDSFAVLADSLGIQTKIDGEYFELKFPKGSKLGAGKFKNGAVFCFVFDSTGVLALVDGKKLDVLKDGIVG